VQHTDTHWRPLASAFQSIYKFKSIIVNIWVHDEGLKSGSLIGTPVAEGGNAKTHISKHTVLADMFLPECI
jgi:hypothetical protein